MARAEKGSAAAAGRLRPAPLLSVRSVCHWLDKSRTWVMGMVYASANDGKPWRVVKVGRTWRVAPESIEAWLGEGAGGHRRSPVGKNRPPGS